MLSLIMQKWMTTRHTEHTYHITGNQVSRHDQNQSSTRGTNTRQKRNVRKTNKQHIRNQTLERPKRPGGGAQWHLRSSGGLLRCLEVVVLMAPSRAVPFLNVRASGFQLISEMLPQTTFTPSEIAQPEVTAGEGWHTRVVLQTPGYHKDLTPDDICPSQYYPRSPHHATNTHARKPRHRHN